ncbi:MFS transporter [Boudabousia liubingyangii]|uniref:nitrate/nitrite transporter n=1 Tax=Boudabousia liubingyangii TaxID=1921764 RepID=UPI00093E5237|nr:nitrate/nitrite transporter [Boudabousia liubingyangii]OKL48335.1 MFS transporter [Boudabousia liubingyangii]
MAQLDTSGRVLQGWDPSKEESWDSKIAWRTLWISTFSLTIAFCVWFLVSAIAPKLNQIGFDLSKAQLYWLAAIPGLSGGLMRLIYMFLPPVIGTRKLVGWSSLLFLIPMIGWFFAVQNPATPYWWLLCLSAMTGIGGGSFAGYMPSTGYFFPKEKQGTALGLQAGIGNFGVSLVQLLGPWVMGSAMLSLGLVMPAQAKDGGEIYVGNIALFFIPWTIIAAVLAFLYLKDVPIKANFKQQIDIFGNKNTWIMTLIYVMTFGAFSGFSAQFALLINNTFGAASDFAATVPADQLPKGLTYAFLGPLIGSAMRAAFGPLCDRFGGAIWTLISGAGMTVTTFLAALYLHPTSVNDFWPFLAFMLGMFFFSGVGNAGTFKQMPMILPPRQAGGVIGWTSAIASFGPFFVGIALSGLDAQVFFFGSAVFFLICTVLTWIYYARPGAPFPG